MQQQETVRIALIGTGSLGSLMARGILERGISGKDELSVCGHNAKNNAALVSQGARNAESATQALVGADVVILAVKPKDIEGVLKEIGSACENKLVVSVAAGKKCETLAKHLPASARLVRAMPNVNMAVGEGYTALYTQNATKIDRAMAQRIFGAFGTLDWMKAEDAMDVLTAATGSGPAIVFRFAQAMVEWMMSRGMDEAAARKATVQLLVGSAKNMKENPQLSPQQLIDLVASPGGTTRAAIAQMDEAGVWKSEQAGLQMAYEKSKTLDSA